MATGMHLIAAVRMELLVHKGLPDRKEHKGLMGLMGRMEHRDQQDRKDLPDQRDQQELPVQLVQQGHKVLRGRVADSTVGI
jgi:hypothetical protein